MKKIILIILLFSSLSFSQGNDRFGTYISQWYDTMLMLTDTTYTGNNGQWIQDGRGNLTNIFLDYLNGRVGFGTDTPLAIVNILGTTEQFRLSYNATNYAGFTVASDGEITLTTVDNAGANADIRFSPDGSSIFDTDILMDSTPSADHTASGTKFVFTAGETVNFGDVVYQLTADGEMYLADATDGTKLPAVYMALETITDGNTGEFLKIGIARDDSWTWTKGGIVYVSITGTTGNTLTQTAPSGSSEVVQILGSTPSAIELDFNPNIMLIVLVP